MYVWDEVNDTYQRDWKKEKWADVGEIMFIDKYEEACYGVNVTYGGNIVWMTKEQHITFMRNYKIYEILH